MSWGADAFVVKSADLGGLKAKIREIMGESGLPFLEKSLE
jgi:hypothetical protein